MAKSGVVQATRDYETRRTQAVPRHTLFGTTLETHSREDLEGMKHLNLNELAAGNRHDCQVPEHLKGSLAGQREQLDSMQRRLREQQQRVSDSSKRLNSLEEMYKYFKVDDVSRSPDYSTDQPLGGLREMSDQVNRMSNGRMVGRRFGLPSGVTQTFHVNDRSVDPDLQAPVDRNLRTYQDAGRAEPVSEEALRRDKGSPRLMTTRRSYFEHDTDACDKFVALPDSLRESHGRCLPANIQHKFGTRFCQSVFSDPCFAEQTLSHSRTGPRGRGGSNGLKRNRRPRPEADYHSLGHLLRYNLGQTYERQFDKGVTQSDFNASVHSSSFPTTNQHRCRKDDLNKWAEQDVIRSRTTKVWDARQAERKEAKIAARI